MAKLRKNCHDPPWQRGRASRAPVARLLSWQFLHNFAMRDNWLWLIYTERGAASNFSGFFSGTLPEKKPEKLKKGAPL